MYVRLQVFRHCQTQRPRVFFAEVIAGDRPDSWPFGSTGQHHIIYAQLALLDVSIFVAVIFLFSCQPFVPMTTNQGITKNVGDVQLSRMLHSSF